MIVINFKGYHDKSLFYLLKKGDVMKGYNRTEVLLIKRKEGLL